MKKRLLKLDNKEVLDALCMLRDCSLKDTRFETQLDQFWDIYGYIDELEQDLKISKANEIDYEQREDELVNKITYYEEILKMIEDYNNETIKSDSLRYIIHNYHPKENNIQINPYKIEEYIDIENTRFVGGE